MTFFFSLFTSVFPHLILFCIMIDMIGNSNEETKEGDNNEENANKQERLRALVALPGVGPALPRFDPSAVKLRKSDEAAVARQKKREASRQANATKDTTPEKDESKQKKSRSPRNAEDKDCVIA
jgi:hypothetical protein